MNGTRPAPLPFLSGLLFSSLFLLSSLSSCGTLPPLLRPDAGAGDETLLRWEIPSPSPEGAERLPPHLIYRNHRSTLPVLIVLLPGTDGAPGDHSLFLKEAARSGYPAIALSYPNRLSVRDSCNPGSLPRCHEKLHRKILFGSDRSPRTEAEVADSITGRLKELLFRLAVTDPEGGWDRFIAEEGEIDYEKVSLSGYSQGAGHAAYLAREKRLLRVGLYSGPMDALEGNGGKIPPWLEGSFATPKDRFYGFTHAKDPVADFATVKKNWRALGIDRFAPARIASTRKGRKFHGFYIESFPADGNREWNVHGMTVRDDDLPPSRNRGVPIYGEVWRRVSFPDL